MAEHLGFQCSNWNQGLSYVGKEKKRFFFFAFSTELGPAPLFFSFFLSKKTKSNKRGECLCENKNKTVKSFYFL